MRQIHIVGRRIEVIATKGGHWRENAHFPIDGRPETLRAHCEISLRTLKVDRIDLYSARFDGRPRPIPPVRAARPQKIMGISIFVDCWYSG
jgi:aryl-alcohol dehydrogenase-like predicted oxidoreductase